MNSNLMTIDGHKAVVSFDPDIRLFRGEFTELAGGADFYAKDVDGLLHEGRISLRVYLATCAERGIEPLAKASGALNLRVSPELHRAATAAAKAGGMSLNQWATKVIREATHHAS